MSLKHREVGKAASGRPARPELAAHAVWLPCHSLAHQPAFLSGSGQGNDDMTNREPQGRQKARRPVDSHRVIHTTFSPAVLSTRQLFEAGTARDSHPAQMRKLKEGWPQSLNWPERQPGLSSGSELMTWSPNWPAPQNELCSFC